MTARNARCIGVTADVLRDAARVTPRCEVAEGIRARAKERMAEASTWTLVGARGRKHSLPATLDDAASPPSSATVPANAAADADRIAGLTAALRSSAFWTALQRADAQLGAPCPTCPTRLAPL